MTDARPACLVTGVVADYRAEPFRLLGEAEDLEVIAWEDSGPRDEGVRVRSAGQLEAARLVGSGRYRAVICGLGGRVALPATYLAAQRAGIPFVLWASIWSHPRTPAHAISWLPTRALYRQADAVVTYGRHVTAYVERRRGVRGNVFEAPQAVDAQRFGAPVEAAARAAARERAGATADGFLCLFVGRLHREKGVRVLLEAWRRAGIGGGAALALAGDGPSRGEVERAGNGVRALGRVSRSELPALYAAADALVLPSIRTATFSEPWGLVVNEAMHQGTPILASDAVGAAAGGLVRDGRNGIVTPERDVDALASAMRTLSSDIPLRERLGAAARADVAPYTYAAWVEGMRRALAAVGAGSRQ
jgi:glycosyltransferase involved in cell wall biosynthesis